ncbi:peroxisomal membrane anchor protein conserved region-domain-containing protein [Hygrophoropsis aurantiaca]|uniref:Peroxisomal membrane anchor protein conserved region-domain-containing protein n=1 Tax=Hygrophoropsis aurantiaca TaxID=72124 RepID=A0ACB8AQF7_9AGAM|nr:peroxisomal membrane anchor protein conserved region-domain-containing protein [Hygrophoropsis aurantiaca]
MTDRQELVRNAVSFLSDFSTQQAPLAQRVQFLEAKGLTGPEIEDAMKQAANQTSGPAPRFQPSLYQSSYPQTYPQSPYPPIPQQWDWRDYFITAVISGTITYGAVSLFKKYLLPHLKPPTATAYEQDRDGLTAQFDAAEALLKEIQAETAAVRVAVEEQKAKVDKATGDVESIVIEMREGEVKTRDEMREIREEVANIREMLPKASDSLNRMIEKNKDIQKQSLAELQQELKSLKALLLSRNSGPLSSSPSTPIPSLTGRPSIPSWQLAGSAPATPSATDIAPPRPGAFTPPTTLEERLRASFTVGDASAGSTPNVSSRASPVPIPVTHHPLSPASTPLPESPVLTPAVAASPPANLRSIISPPATPIISAFPVNSVDQTIKDAPASSSFSANSGDDTIKNTPEAPMGIGVSAESPRDADTSPPPSPVVETTVEIANVIDPATAELKGTDMEGMEIVDQHKASEIALIDPASLEEEIQKLDDIPHVDEESNVLEPPPVVQDTVEETISATPAVQTASEDDDLESLQQRLKLVEQRFSDVSTSFKRLQAERLVVDQVFRDLTPLEDTKDVEALRDFLSNMNIKTELTQDELQRLNGKLIRQEERIEELRDTHRLESSSQSAQIEKLRKQVEEAEALLAASQVSSSHSDTEIIKRNTEIDRLNNEIAKVKESAKEEEEKRVKAISLLKTVRQKLVKAEKERDDVTRESNDAREREKQEKEKEKAERSKLQSEIDVANSEREKAIIGLRAQFDKELTLTKDRAERELSAVKGQLELEIITLKSSHSSELSAKSSHISVLENSVNNLSKENKSFFEQLQVRQAELESSQSHSETLQSQNIELQFQLRETQERITLLTEEMSELHREQDMRLQPSNPPPEDSPHLISAMESKYEVKLAELKRDMAAIEKGRDESEANWSRKLLDKAREAEELKRVLQSFTNKREGEENINISLKTEISRLKLEVQTYQRRSVDLQTQIDQVKDNESSVTRRISDVKAQVDTLAKQLEESQGRETQLRFHNQTLRDELRKVQSSAALLERQRNPGVGYWMARNDTTNSRTSMSSASDLPSRVQSPGPSSPAPSKADEDINLEYLRNVILQFLEHKEMRPNLVRVLSIILRFTPQETRRLIAKV